jgi:hypothetical protein
MPGTKRKKEDGEKKTKVRWTFFWSYYSGKKLDPQF